MNQGVRKHRIFETDDDRFRFLDDLRTACEEHETDVAAYCLMGNHFHLVVRSLDGDLSATMQQLGTRYVRRFNRRYGYVGPLFRSRFVSVPIASDSQLLAVIRYVHRNPLELGYRLDSYPWSSHRHYMGHRASDWLAAELPLRQLGGPAAYVGFVERPMPADRFSMNDGVRAWRPSNEPDEALLVAEAIDASRHVAHDRTARAVAILLAVDVLGASPSVVARELGLPGVNAVHSVLSRGRRRQTRDAAFAAEIRNAASRLTSSAA